MKILTKISVCICLIMLLTSCAATLDAIKSVNTSALKIGMTKAQVQEVLKKKPYGTVSAKNYPETNTTIEVVEYSQSDGSQRIDRYWLYFINDKLEKWEPASTYYQPAI